MRAKIILVCTVCLSRNYQTSKQKFGVSDRFEVNKFCPKCAKHTLHKESK